MVTMWIVNSMTKVLAHIFLHAEIVQLWRNLMQRYASTSEPLKYGIERELLQISQGTTSVTKYFNKLKKLLG